MDSEGLRCVERDDRHTIYEISILDFWSIEEESGVPLWYLLIHLVDTKPWVTEENVNDLNVAFFFCQDYFKAYKPKNSVEASTAQTLLSQRRILEVRKEHKILS